MKKIPVLLVLCMAAGFAGTGVCEKAQAPADPKAQFSPKKVEVDSNYDGKVDRTEYYDEKGQVIRVEIDSNWDGVIDEYIYYDKGKPAKSARDTNKDGKPDVWIEF